MQFQEIVILVPRRRCLLIDQLLSQAFCLIVFGSFLALRLSFLSFQPLLCFRNIQTPKQASVVLKSTRKENKRRKESCKFSWNIVCRIWCGEDNLELSIAPSKTDLAQGIAAPPEFEPSGGAKFIPYFCHTRPPR
jgi:hypothetical protein